MPIKLANNASARLASPLANTDTTAVLVMDDIQNFPALAAGEWHPLTIINETGNFEIVRVTDRDTNILTIDRGQEGTAAMNFFAGARVEIRLTAAAINAIQIETMAANQAAIAAAKQEIDEDVAANKADTDADLAALTPTGSLMAWSLTTEPTGWIFADGRTLLSNTPYGALRAAYIASGFPHGNDGSGNPKIPDLRGRVPAGRDNMGTAAGRLTGGTLGAALGAETHTLTAAQMPVHNHAVSDPGHNHGVNDPTHAHSVYDPGHNHGLNDPGHRHSYTHSTVTDGTVGNGASHSLDQAANTGFSGTGITLNAAATGIGIYGAGTGIWLSASGTGVSTQNNGSGQAHNNVQPTLVVNWLVKT